MVMINTPPYKPVLYIQESQGGCNCVINSTQGTCTMCSIDLGNNTVENYMYPACHREKDYINAIIPNTHST